jgi:uncharacterized protein
MVTFILITLVFLTAGAVKGLSGMGLPTIAIALLSLFMPVGQAALLMVLPALTTNITQCFGGHLPRLVKKFGLMWVLIAVVTLFSPFSGLTDDGAGAIGLLGAVLITYGAWGLGRPLLARYLSQSATSATLVASSPKEATSPDLSAGVGTKDEIRPVAGFFVGAFTGLLTAATGVSVLPLVPYLQSSSLSKNEFIQALGISFTVANVALLVRLGTSSSLNVAAQLPMVAVAVAAAFGGLWIGSVFRGRLNPMQFQRMLHAVFCGLGLIMLVRFFQ